MRAMDILMPRSTQRALSALLLHPERELIQNELVAAAGAGRGRGLVLARNLVDAGLARARRVGRSVLLSANPAHPLFPELRALCVKSFGIADRIREAFSPWATQINAAAIFGSVARGEEQADSDLDLLVVGDVSLLDLAPAIIAIEEAVGRRVDLLLYGPGEWTEVREQSVMRTIRKDAKIVVMGDADDL
jgi:predicted nucleotidyltransferase